MPVATAYWNHFKRFGYNRDIVIERDREKCISCGMTRKEHLEKWNCDLTIDHIDGQGRYSSLQNHDLSNLQTLCLSCHGKKDILRREIVRNQYMQIGKEVR